MTTRSAPVLAASAVTLAGSAGVTGWISATCAIPGLPGATCKAVTSPSRARARARACSRPPDPMTRTRIGSAARHIRGLSWSVWSRRGPTPMPHNGAPIMSSSALTYAWALRGSSPNSRAEETSSHQPSRYS